MFSDVIMRVNWLKYLVILTQSDGSVDFDVASMSGIDKKGIYAVNTKDDQGRDVLITYGTNIEKLKEIGYHYEVSYAGDMGKILTLGASSYTYDVEIGDTIESAIIEMKYSSTATPDIKVTDPDGKTYTLVDEATGAENANYRRQIIPADISESREEEKRLFVTIVSPALGTWKVASDQEVTTTLYNAKVPAAFESLSALQEEGKIKVDWTLNETIGSKVSLYLIREGDASGFIELGKDLAGDLEPFQSDIPAGVTTGRYKVRAEVKRDGSGFDDMDSEAFEIVDAASPLIPAGYSFTVETAGNGMMRAEWDDIAEVDEYRIYAVDNKGAIDKTVKTMVSADGDKTNTVFGGMLKDAGGNEYGWLPGRAYRFALYAVKVSGEVDSEIEYISKPVYSGELDLPVPEPPVFTVSFSAEDGNINIEKDQNDNEIRYTNTSTISSSYQSEDIADVKFYVNSDYVDGDRANEIEQELELSSGSNLIEIEAVGENGDKTIKTYEFYYDDKAPDLLIQSPNSIDTIQAGTVLVSGKTTAGSRLYVNGTQMTVAEDGSFNEEYILSNLQRETIIIASVDMAGNRTEYSAEVLNSDVGNVVKVQIMPQIVQLRVGDSIQLRLYGVMKDNNKVLLEADKVDWQLYDTEGAASITADGLLTALKPGESVVNGQYFISNDTTYEDAYIIKVLPKVNNRKDDNDEDRSKDIDSSDTDTKILVKRSLDFKANEEIAMPGLIKIRFTGNEAFPNGYVEVLEIKDLLQYRQQSGNKDFLSNIYDINAPVGYKFNSPVELTLYFDKNKVKDIKNIGIYVYNEKIGTWDMAGGVVDEKDGSITVKRPHFSKYAVMENSKMTLMEDMDGHWARDAVYRLVDRGIVNGIKSTDGKYRFEPERTVTRSEFAKMLSLSEGYQQNDTNADLSYFTDDSEIQPWARPYLKYSSKKGWIKGKAVGGAVYIKPNDTITRAEAAVMISRALGFSDNTFRPNSVLTRAEAAKIFDTYVFIQGIGLF